MSHVRIVKDLLSLPSQNKQSPNDVKNDNGIISDLM